MTRAELRGLWRMYWHTRHALFPYQQPAQRPSWPERAWIRIFG